MPVQTLKPSQEQIAELRQLFLERLAADPPQPNFHPIDIERVQHGNIWCQRFLEQYDLNMQQSLDKLWETCVWRQQYGANELNEHNLCQEYLHHGEVFAHNKDIDGNPLLIFRMKLHSKGTKDMKELIRLVVYWIERIHRETNMAQITLVFDSSGTGLSNLDPEFFKSIIETFKLYYPNALYYILVFELPWMLTAAFKLIKGLLPPKAVEILRMVGKKDINNYIDKSNCLLSWGGEDKYEYMFKPESKYDTQQLVADVPATAPPKKVHFDAILPESEQHTDIQSSNTTSPDLLRLAPEATICFNKPEGYATLNVANISSERVSYKIQTTSPLKFRVRPRCGILNVGETVNLRIVLHSTQQQLNQQQTPDPSRDKFMLMVAPVPADAADFTNQQQLAEFWQQKANNKADVQQHLLHCSYETAMAQPQKQNGLTNNSTDAPLTHSKEAAYNAADLAKYAKRLQQQLHNTQLLQFGTLALLLLVFVAVIYLLLTRPSTTEVEQLVCRNSEKILDKSEL